MTGDTLGGVLSHPERKFSLFNSDFWRRHPFALPCFAASIVSAIASVYGGLTLREVRYNAQRRYRLLRDLMECSFIPRLDHHVHMNTSINKHRSHSQTLRLNHSSHNFNNRLDDPLVTSSIRFLRLSHHSPSLPHVFKPSSSLSSSWPSLPRHSLLFTLSSRSPHLLLVLAFHQQQSASTWHLDRR